jgi:hypothetical protein
VAALKPSGNLGMSGALTPPGGLEGTGGASAGVVNGAGALSENQTMNPRIKP